MTNVTSPMEHHDKLWAEYQAASARKFETNAPEDHAACQIAHQEWAKFFLKFVRFDSDLRRFA